MERLQKIHIDLGEQLAPETRKKLEKMINEHKEIFGLDLPGYNHHSGKLEATFDFATRSRPKCNRTWMPDYNISDSSLQWKIEELMGLRVLCRASELDIQLAFKNNSFLVKK